MLVLHADRNLVHGDQDSEARLSGAWGGVPGLGRGWLSHNITLALPSFQSRLSFLFVSFETEGQQSQLQMLLNLGYQSAWLEGPKGRASKWLCPATLLGTSNPQGFLLASYKEFNASKHVFWNPYSKIMKFQSFIGRGPKTNMGTWCLTLVDIPIIEMYELIVQGFRVLILGFSTILLYLNTMLVYVTPSISWRKHLGMVNTSVTMVLISFLIP